MYLDAEWDWETPDEREPETVNVPHVVRVRPSPFMLALTGYHHSG